MNSTLHQSQSLKFIVNNFTFNLKLNNFILNYWKSLSSKHIFIILYSLDLVLKQCLT